VVVWKEIEDADNHDRICLKENVTRITWEVEEIETVKERAVSVDWMMKSQK
jgi:hypothetical protein